MGCEVQMHEKTDKHGTWSYHLVDGWYLSTSGYLYSWRYVGPTVERHFFVQKNAR